MKLHKSVWIRLGEEWRRGRTSAGEDEEEGQEQVDVTPRVTAADGVVLVQQALHAQGLRRGDLQNRTDVVQQLRHLGAHAERASGRYGLYHKTPRMAVTSITPLLPTSVRGSKGPHIAAS